MKIKEYYKEVLEFCSSSPLISDFHLDFEEIDEQTGYISGILDFTDSSNLHLAEYIEILEKELKRVKYRYHWQKADLTLIARWDNVPHYKNVSTFPFHSHQGDKILPSQPMDLFSVIKEIEKKII